MQDSQPAALYINAKPVSARQTSVVPDSSTSAPRSPMWFAADRSASSTSGGGTVRSSSTRRPRGPHGGEVVWRHGVDRVDGRELVEPYGLRCTVRHALPARNQLRNVLIAENVQVLREMVAHILLHEYCPPCLRCAGLEHGSWGYGPTEVATGRKEDMTDVADPNQVDDRVTRLELEGDYARRFDTRHAWAGRTSSQTTGCAARISRTSHCADQSRA